MTTETSPLKFPANADAAASPRGSVSNAATAPWLPLETVKAADPASAVRLADAREDAQWPALQQRLQKRSRRRDLDTLWGDWGAADRPLRWGLAAATDGPVEPTLRAVTRLAARKRLSPGLQREIDLTAAAEALLDQLSRPHLALPDLGEALPWAYALPALADRLAEPLWWELLAALQTLHQAALGQVDAASPLRLLAGGELGLLLSWRLRDLPSCAASETPSVEAAFAWFDAGSEAIEEALNAGGRYSRLILASALRTQRLLKRGYRKNLRKSRRATLAELATWAAALTQTDGRTAFAQSDREAVKEDLCRGGLIEAAAEELNDDAIRQAVQAALGKSKSGGRLAWQISLPEPGLINEAAKLAVLLPEWDVRRGRLAIDYQGETCRLQLHAGQPLIIDGAWAVALRADGQPQAPTGRWESVCEYSDDDVHYLELQQAWSGGLSLQRHCLLIRDDRCVLLADAVLQDPATSAATPQLEYEARLPLADALQVTPEAETRELWLGDHKPRALCVPIGLPEWRVGPTPGSLEVTADQDLVLRMRGAGQLVAPLWFDCQRRRFRRPRTWRQLTVAEELRIVAPCEAVAYRVQAGSEQWLLYRNLAARAPRTVLGAHLVADFYGGRFDPSDGSLEELVKVEAT